MKDKKCITGEIALLLGLVFNSFASTLMIKSQFGVSSITSVPYSLSLAFNKLTYGTWNYIFQCTLIAILVIATRKFKIGYIISFFLAVVFGNLIDFFNSTIMQMLPNNYLLNTIYFIVSFITISVGMSLLLNCKTPVLPIDTFTRDFPIHFNIPYKRSKTIFDLSCLAATIVISLIFLKKLVGIGVGTVVCAFITGKTVSYINSFIDKRFYFEPAFTRLKNRKNDEDKVSENKISENYN